MTHTEAQERIAELKERVSSDKKRKLEDWDRLYSLEQEFLRAQRSFDSKWDSWGTELASIKKEILELREIN